LISGVISSFKQFLKIQGGFDMGKMKIQRLLIAFILLPIMLTEAKAQNKMPNKEAFKYKITFIELGSVRCIPCQKMQVVMKSIEKKYGSQVKVVFHDVWTPEGKPFGEKYGIEVIPTQVFLDENGKEFSRHEGYFPEEELVKVLKSKGVK
jgi:thioredoxin 1